MAVMGYLRERMGKIVAGLIGFSLLAFIVTEVIKSGGSFLKGDTNELGAVGDEKIPLDEYNKAVDQNTAQFKQQSGQSSVTPQITAYVQDNTWNQFVSKAIIRKEVEKLGLVVSPDETQAMTTGTNPDRQVIQAFTDPQTGRFDRANLISVVNNIKSQKDDNPQKIRWVEFVTQLIEAKLGEKYMSMVTNGLYVNSLDAKDNYENKNKLANFKYAVLDYASVADSKVTLTDADYSSYYDEHKAEFKNPQELRSISYVSFNGAPSAEDSVAIKQQISKLIPDFKASTNDSLFVQINSETKAPLIYQHKGQLDPKIDTVMFKASNGFVFGPYLSNGSFKLAKLVDSRVGPDSVKAKHILISPVDGGMPKAIATADSLKKLIESGKKSFADLASTFSVDKGSAAKGGELGMFGRGSMVPAFEEAVFNGKKGDLKIVTTQYGAHLIQIEDQKGSSKVVKVAVIDKPLSASTKTQSAAYSKAQAFLISLTKDNFDAQAKKGSLSVKTADDVTGVARTLPGLDDARDLIRWAFKSAKGDISDQVFTIGNQYIVAHVTQIKPQGTLALDLVKKQIEPAVRNQVKGKLLTDKFAAAISGSSSIEQIAQKAGAKVVPVQNIVFANPVIPGSSAEYKVVGSVFGSPINKISKPVAGQQGVYVFTVNNFISPAPLTNAVREKEQIGQAMMQRSEGQIFEALKDKDNVKDYRAKLL
ncbi:SurA N-terminal domain-containing protein [Mucilaginibacter sp.]|uniref:peptidylprolyl isomerase n=1 Tax=Mucilaginibacter sp. TaxID=1882438 RepID=UPI00262049C4|nr:SurA N-terminal domain-containing protein [Mucilaginibacter sp.]MDB4925756.1 peptidylprolyl isomerase [Mucilaginibacter sp.]